MSFLAKVLKFDPSQPRAPKGSPDGGQWVSAEASAMRALEEHQRSSKVERLITVDRATNRVLHDAVGDASVDRANFNAGVHDMPSNFGEIMDAKDVLDMHTHPDASSFSDADWGRFSWSHVKEMRVVAADHVFALRKTPQWEALPYSKRTPAAVKARWNELVDAMFTDGRSLTMSTEQMIHEANVELAKELGIDYTATVRVQKFDPSQPRDPKGTHTGGRWTAWLGHLVQDDPNAPFETDDPEAALRELAHGRRVNLKAVRQVSTMLDKLAEIVRDAVAKGEKAPIYDLCKVTVRGTNIFCIESKRLKRIAMPQLSGDPLPGSKADQLPRNRSGGVDLAPLFKDYLREHGYTATDQMEYAAFLKATQHELNGAKVANMVQAIKHGRLPEASIFVSQDNYVLDGHHRWAAQVGIDAEDNKLGQQMMPVVRVNAGIMDLMQMAHDFTIEMGVPPRGVDAIKVTKRCESCERRKAKVLGFLQSVAKRWSEADHPRGKTTADSTPGSFAPKPSDEEIARALANFDAREDMKRRQREVDARKAPPPVGAAKAPTMGTGPYENLYHGTAEDVLARILKEGIRPGSEAGVRRWDASYYYHSDPAGGDEALMPRGKRVFLAHSYDEALHWTGKATTMASLPLPEGSPKPEAVVLQVRMPRDEYLKTTPDDLVGGEALMYPGTVKPEWIMGYWRIPHGKEHWGFSELDRDKAEYHELRKADGGDTVVVYVPILILPHPLAKAWEESQHPRGKSGPGTNDGSFTDSGKGVSGGRFDSMREALQNAATHEIAHRLARDHGFTFQPYTLDTPTEGYALSVSQANERVFAGEVTEGDLHQYVTEHDQLLRDNPQAHLGGWVDAETGKVYLDISIVEPKLDKAVALAKQHGQEGIYDLASAKTILTKEPDERRKSEDGALPDPAGLEPPRGRGVHQQDAQRSHGEAPWLETILKLNLGADVAQGIHAHVWDEEKHPRGKTTEASTPGSWAPAENRGGPRHNERMRKDLRKQLESFGVPSAYIDAANERLRKAFKGARLAINRRTVDVMEDFLTGSGRMKSQFETNASDGTLDPSLRARIEADLFAIPNDVGHAPEERAIYGYVLDGDHPNPIEHQNARATSSYGRIKLLLKPEVGHRATWTGTDSLNEGQYTYYPSPLTNPDIMTTMSQGDVAGYRYDVELARRVDPTYSAEKVVESRLFPLGKDNAADPQVMDYSHGYSYVEAQMHGQVRKTDVEAMWMKPEDWSALSMKARYEVERLGWTVHLYDTTGGWSDQRPTYDIIIDVAKSNAFRSQEGSDYANILEMEKKP